MKIKPINSEVLCNKARFNDNISSSHLRVTKSNGNDDKKDYASIMLLSLMDERGFFDIAFHQVETHDSFMIVDKMLDNANASVDNTFLKDRSL